MMDWRSIEGIHLLRQAYPCGYLPLRSVRTIGGWEVEECWPAEDDAHVGTILFRPPGPRPGTWRDPIPGCVGPDGQNLEGGLAYTSDSRHRSEEEQELYEADDAGDLLPLPNRLDVATWALMKWDLARAVGCPYATSPLWLPIEGVWSLALASAYGAKGFIKPSPVRTFEGIPTDMGSQQALVLARAQLRKESS